MRFLVVVQPSANHYREPFVRELLKNNRVEVVLFGRYNSQDQSESHEANSPFQASDTTLSMIHRMKAKKIAGSLTWDEGLFAKALREDSDLYVLAGNVYNVTTWILAILLRLRRKKVAFWGHGWKRSESGIKLSVRKVFYRLANAHFVYGNWAIEYARSVGFSEALFFPIYNSFTSEESLSAVLKKTSAEQSELKGSTAVTLIYSGRLTQRHGVERALDAVLQLRAEQQLDVNLVIVGDGPERSALAEMVRDDEDAALFLGAVYSMEKLSEIYLDADYAISPGASGLNVVQALCFNVPVIAAAGDLNSGPELEAIQHGETGYLYPGHDIEAMKTTILETQSQHGKAKRKNLVRKGAKLVRERYTAEQHAGAFIEAGVQVINGNTR